MQYNHGRHTYARVHQATLNGMFVSISLFEENDERVLSNVLID